VADRDAREGQLGPRQADRNASMAHCRFVSMTQWLRRRLSESGSGPRQPPALPAASTHRQSQSMPCPASSRCPSPRVDAGVPEQGLQDGQVAPRSRPVKRGAAKLQGEEAGGERAGEDYTLITGGPMRE